MAVTQQQLTELYLAYFGRPADIGGIQFYTANPANTMQSVAANFSASPESLSLYGATFGAAQIDAIYQNLFNRNAEAAGQAYWSAEVSAGRISSAGVLGDQRLGAVQQGLALEAALVHVGHAVGVVQHDQAPQPQVSGQRDDLVADALHQAAVADQRVGVVVHDVVAEFGVEHGLGHSHAGRVGDALAQRPGGRLDAMVRLVFRVPGRVRAEFTEALDLLDRKGLVAGQMQQGVDQSRTVAVGLHEAVAVRPARPIAN